MSSTVQSDSFSFQLGRIIRGLEAVSGRFMRQMAAGYQHEAIREYQGNDQSPDPSIEDQTAILDDDFVVECLNGHLRGNAD